MSKHRCVSDVFHAKGDLVAEHSLVSGGDAVVIGNILITNSGYLQAYKFREDKVPLFITEVDDTVELGDAGPSDILHWVEYAKARGWAQNFSTVFPSVNYSHDFDEIAIGEHSWKPIIDALQEQVDSLDDLFNTPAEHITQILQDLQNAGNIATYVSDAVAAEALVRAADDQKMDAEISALQSDGGPLKLDKSTPQTVTGELRFSRILPKDADSELGSVTVPVKKLYAQDAKLDTIQAGAASVWVGDVHISADADQRTRLHQRVKQIPKAWQLLSAPVVEGDYTALGYASSTATLEQTQEVAVSKGLSDKLGDIYPAAHVDDDFTTESSFNKIVVSSQDSQPVVSIRGSDPKLTLKSDSNQLYAQLAHNSSSGNFITNILSKAKKQVQGSNVWEWDSSGLELQSGKTLKRDGGTDLFQQVTDEVSARTAAVSALDGRVSTVEGLSSVTDPISATQVAADIQAAKSELLGNAPAAALDTLKELGQALGDDASFATTVTTSIATKVAQSAYDTKQAAQDSAIALNTAKVGFTDALVAAAPSVAANTTKVGYTDALVAAAPSVQANTAKVSYSDASAVAANTAKISYTDASAVAANTAKISYTDASAVAANTAKVGLLMLL